MTQTAAILETPIGNLGVQMAARALIGITLNPDKRYFRAASVARHISQEILAYFSDPNHFFALDYVLSGTAFQLQVWQALIKIPVGETRSYGALAKTLHTSARAVGNACRANPIALIIPCHRVIAHDGTLGGFNGKTSGLSLRHKHWLLQHEQALTTG